MRHLIAVLPVLSDLRILSLAAAMALALVTLVLTGDLTTAAPGVVGGGGHPRP